MSEENNENEQLTQMQDESTPVITNESASSPPTKESDEQEKQQMEKPNQPQLQPMPEQNFIPRVGFMSHPRMRYPPPGHSFPPSNGAHGPGMPHMRSQYRQPNFMQGSGNGEPPPSFFNNPSTMHRMGGQPGMGLPPRGPPMGHPMGGPRPPFAPGFAGAPPGYRPHMGMGMPPFFSNHGVPHGTQQNGQLTTNGSAQPINQAERLKKLAGVTPDKELWIETKTNDGKAYYYHSETRQTVWECPDPNKAVVMQQDELQKLVEQAQREEKEQQQHGLPGAAMPGHPYMMQGFPPTNPNDTWQEFAAPDGRKYYYNYLTRENTWTKPKALVEKESAVNENGGNIATSMANGISPAMSMMAATVAPVAGVGYAGFRPSVATGGPQAALSGTVSGQKDKTRPVSSTAVTGTPWCVVWTGDNRVFFYNPSTRTSVWERPPELYSRPDVDLLVSKPPPTKEQKTRRAQKRQKREESEEEEEDEEEDEDNEEVEDESENANSVDEQNEEQPMKKKTRKEKKAEKEKQRQEQLKQPKQPLPIQQEKPIDPAIQAELEAQRDREKIPLEERIKQFRQLLEDKKVSATSTWEKELSKIVFDQRYLLLSAVERKAAFDAYCRERAEIEKEEKKKKAKKVKDAFTKLLEEANLHGKSSYSSFSTKWAKDLRFKAVEKNRDRESYFKDFVEELYKKEKEQKRIERDKAKEEFMALLNEQTDLRRNSIWAIVKKRLDKDSRYKNKYLDSEMRQRMFEEHVKNCPEPTEEEEEEAKRIAAEALEASAVSKETEKGNNEDREKNKERERKKKKREKIEKTAEEKALEDRKREVEEELGEHLKERNREHERHKMQEHEQNFKALLADLIKNTDVSWHDARKQLKKDARYENCDLLEKDVKERLFREHIRDLERKKRDLFYQLLDDHQEITFATKWHHAKKIITDDERFVKLKVDERKVEHEYRDWMDRRYHQALDNFETLLRETKIITYKSKQMIVENEQHLRDILAILENDKRYLVLKDRPNERERILDDYLDALDRKGPPPPPTRNEDTDRRRK